MACEHNPNILDPSCGTGAAVNLLAELLGGTAWGNEIEKNRATEAKKLLFAATVGPMETIELSGGKADILFTNPPYDWQDGERLETAHLRASAELVRHWGLVIAVVPEITVRNEGWWKMWHSYYDGTELRRYPDEAFKLWKQYVVFGVRRPSRQYYLVEHQATRSLNEVAILSC
jgi:tRNA G10  N-methylase Trm11